MNWPKVVHAVGTPDYPDEGIALYRDGLPGGLADDPDHEIRRYLPKQESPIPEEAMARALHRAHCGCAADDWCDSSYLVAASSASGALLKQGAEEERERLRRELQDAFDHILNVEGKLPGLHDIFDRVFPDWEREAADNQEPS